MCKTYFNCINYELVIALTAIIVSVLAIRYQIVTLIASQLSDKARETNSYLDQNYNIPETASGYSSVYSSIITAKQILDLHSSKYRLLCIALSKQYLIDQYYLQLHTTVRQTVQKENSPGERFDPVLQRQHQCCNNFLEASANIFQ